jgi:beta-glucosidase
MRLRVADSAPLAILAAAVVSASLSPDFAPAAPSGDAVVMVSSDRAVYATDEGSTVRVEVTVNTRSGARLADQVAVRYATGAGTATAGVDYTAAAGTLTFPAGTRSGTAAAFAVNTARDGAAETAETIPITLASPNADVQVAASPPTVVIGANGLPYLDPRLPAAARVSDLLGRMTLAEKVGQMTQAERDAVTGDPTLITTWRLGSLLSGGGSTPTPNTPRAWADMVDRFQSYALLTRLQIPLLYGVDSVHGHGNLVGATIFPHNIGLGATRDPALVEQVGRVVAAETRTTGPQWVFGPCLCVARDIRWGRTYESFGEDPSLVTAMETAIDGFQGLRSGELARGDRVLATAKHYAGAGDTEYGTSGTDGYKIDQGVAVTNEPDFARIDLAPYLSAVRAHRTGSVMPSYSSVDWTADGAGNPIKMHVNRQLITEVLKRRAGFDGFVVTDWEAIHQLPGDWAAQVRTAVNAGIDMFMEPFGYQAFETTLVDEALAGRVPMARIDDAVRRILTKKFQLGLFEHAYTDRAGLAEVGSAEHREVARRAVAESQVLLKNRGRVLPLSRTARIYLAGGNADNIGNQAGGWTVQWQGASGRVIPGSTILDGIRQVAPNAQVTYSPDAFAPVGGSDVGVVVVGETPYAEGFGDVGGPQWNDNGVLREPKGLELSEADRDAVDRVCGAISRCVVVVVAGRPQVVTDQLDEIDALVASWLPGSEGEGVADVLFGHRPFTGRLSQTWPRAQEQEPINAGDARYDPLYPFGWGLRTDSPRMRLERARAELARSGEARMRAAAAELGRAVEPRNWNPDGSARRGRDLVGRLAVAAAQLTRARSDTLAHDDAVVSVVRDLAQAAIAGRAHGVPANAAGWSALAEQQLLSGRPDRALAMLLRAGGLG